MVPPPEFTHDANGTEWVRPASGPRKPAPPLPRRPRVRPAAPRSGGPANPWTEAKVEAVLASFRSFASNAALKHGVSTAEVLSLVKDHLVDPG